MQLHKDRVEIASDINEKDGIGVEIYRNDELMVEIFRDDTLKSRTVTLFKKDISLELMEESIALFKKEIPGIILITRNQYNTARQIGV